MIIKKNAYIAENFYQNMNSLIKGVMIVQYLKYLIKNNNIYSQIFKRIFVYLLAYTQCV